MEVIIVKVHSKIIKLFGLMIFVVTSILVLFVLFNINQMKQRGNYINEELDSNSQTSVKQELQDLADSIGNYVLVLESEIDRSMYNAAMTLYEYDKATGGNVSLEELERIKEETGMSDLYLGDNNGVFTISTEPEAIGLSLFDIWDGYKMLVTGESKYISSDIKIKVETGEIFKFTAVPRADNRGILESALEAGAIEEYLQRFIESNQTIKSMNLFDVTLLTLTGNYIEGVNPIYTKGQAIPVGTTEIDDFFNGQTSIKMDINTENAQIYYPIIDNGRVRYVLFIDLDTTTYFETQNLVNSSIEGLVHQNTGLSFISFATIFIVLLFFTIFISLIVSKLIENLEKANTEAKIANEAKSTFLSNMSHEIRTPLNAIIGMTSIGMHAGDITKSNDCFSKIDVASKNLLGIINDILDMSKIEAGKFVLSDSDFDFPKMLSQVEEINKFRMDEKKQSFEVSTDKDIPQFLYGDDQRLSQVISNLLNNAAKFSPVSGIIKLDSKLLEKNGDTYTLQIAVSDNGIGISSEQQDILFNSFQQAENNTSRKFGGTGLGLAISKKIVEMMGGRIWIDSALGEGSTFTFTIEIKQGKDTSVHEDNSKEDTTYNFEGHTILLAEDVEINREIVLALLEPTSIKIDCAEN